MTEPTGSREHPPEPGQADRGARGFGSLLDRTRRGERFHLMILGGGTAGIAAAETAAALGARVALITRRELGGDRVSYGAPRISLLGTTQTAERTTFAEALAKARSLRSLVAAENDAERLRGLGVDVIVGQGRFVASDAIEVEGRRLHFRRALVATGAQPKTWQIPGLEKVEILTLATVFELERPPRRLGVLGGGARACELAQAFARLGVEVHLFERRARILGRCAADAAEIVGAAMRRDGVELHLGRDVESVRDRGSKKLVVLAPDSREIEVDGLLLADGRAPNVTGLGLEAAGVEYDLSGIEIDRRLRTSNRRIFAVGDAVSTRAHPHADDAARAAVYNALLRRRLQAPRAVPRAVFTRPQIAWVGLDAEGLEDAPPRIETLHLDLSASDPARRDAPATGFLRLSLHHRTGRILGGVLLAEDAAEAIAPLALATRHGLRLVSFAEALSPFGARADMYRRAALKWRKVHRRSPLPRALFELLLRLAP